MIKAIDSLEAIKVKVMAKQTDFNKIEKDCLKEVWEEIQLLHGKKRALDISCSSCVANASTIVYNFLMEQNLVRTEPKNITKVIVEEVENDTYSVEELEAMKLPELRALFPQVKAKFKADFISELQRLKLI